MQLQLWALKKRKNEQEAEEKTEKGDPSTIHLLLLCSTV